MEKRNLPGSKNNAGRNNPKLQKKSSTAAAPDRAPQSRKKKTALNWDKKSIIEFFVYSIIIIVVSYSFYSPAKDFGLVFCDDNIFVLDYAEVNKSVDNIPKAFDKTIGTSYYRPILAISFIMDAQKGGVQPWIYHQTNILLHVIGSWLVFVFLFKIGYPKVMSFIFGMMFALHPILTPAACWISGRNDSLITVFILMFFITLTMFLKNRKWHSWFFLIFNLLAFVLALFTKEIAAMIPFVSFMYILFYMEENKAAVGYLWKAIKFDDAGNNLAKFRKGFVSGMFNLKTIILYVSWFLIGLKWWSMRMAALEGIKNPDTIGFDALVKNFATVPAMFGKIFLPVKLIALSNFESFSIISGIAVMVIIAALALFLRNVNKSNALFGFLWFVVFLFPTLMVRIVYVDDFFDYAEHRAYLAMIGIIIIVVEIVRSFKVDFKKPLPIIISCLIIGAFLVRSYVYIPVFENRTTFWTHMIDMYPFKSRGYLDLGKAYYVKGDLTTAEKLYFMGVQRNPYNFNLYIDLSAVYMRESKFSKAEQFARKAVSLDKTNPIANYNLGKSLLQQNRISEALEPLEIACKRGGKYPHWFVDLGVIYFKLNKLDESIQAYFRALQLDPNIAIAYANIGAAYARKDDLKNAEAAWQRAAALDPKIEEPITNLIRLYFFKKEYDKAKQYAILLKNNGGAFTPEIIRRFKELNIQF